MKALDAYYFTQSENLSSCLLSLRALILSADPQMKESLKWGIPCFIYGKHICCFLNIDRKSQQPYILFSNGQQLHHPKLEQGGRKKMKSLPVPADKDLPIKVIQNILHQAIASYA